MIKFLLPFIFVAPTFAATVYFDGTFNQSNWQTRTLEATNGNSMTLTQQLAGGNPDSYLRVVFNVPSGPGQTSGLASTVQFRSDFAWNPQTDGALTDIKFEMDIRNLGSTSFGTPEFGMFWRPAVVQNGIMYSSANQSQRPAANGSFESKVWDLLASDSWLALPNQNPDPNLPLDFSANGTEIYFGFRVAEGATCGAPQSSFCNQATKTDGLDNFRVTVNGASEIPEPSTFALATLGLAVALKCRSTGGTRTDAAAAVSPRPHTCA